MAELRYVNDRILPGIRRVRRGRHFQYIAPHGRTVSHGKVLQRIRSLAIPPAWTRVWICPDPEGHIQATGRDARGRKQYRYHPRWRVVRDEVKYGRLLEFAAALPRIRARTASDLRRSGLPREKVIATVVELLEKTFIRVGNDEYARSNHSFGLTTLRDRHAHVNGTSVRFEFLGKSGVFHTVKLQDARVCRVIKACRDLPGQELFQYIDEAGLRQSVGSGEVNQYLREVTGHPFTSKDFRTWAGTVLAARLLLEATNQGKALTRRTVIGCIKIVAKQLGNTPAVCRRCYIHPAILVAYTRNHLTTLPPIRRTQPSVALAPEELAVVALLKKCG